MLGVDIPSAALSGSEWVRREMYTGAPHSCSGRVYVLCVCCSRRGNGHGDSLMYVGGFGFFGAWMGTKFCRRFWVVGRVFHFLSTLFFAGLRVCLFVDRTRFALAAVDGCLIGEVWLIYGE